MSYSFSVGFVSHAILLSSLRDPGVCSRANELFSGLWLECRVAGRAQFFYVRFMPQVWLLPALYSQSIVNAKGGG